jgi:fatty-acid desaturase
MKVYCCNNLETEDDAERKVFKGLYYVHLAIIAFSCPPARVQFRRYRNNKTKTKNGSQCDKAFRIVKVLVGEYLRAFVCQVLRITYCVVELRQPPGHKQ